MHNYTNILAYTNWDLVGEWLFSPAAFPEFMSDNEVYLSHLLHTFPYLESDHLLRIREKATAFVDETAKNIAALHPRIAGCSNVFYQNCVSLVLLRRIRELLPEVVTVLGGANCECEMGIELHERYQWVDYVFSGEADVIFPESCRRILNDEPIVSGGHKFTKSIRIPEDRLNNDTHLNSERVCNLTSLSPPDFDDYFTALEESSLEKIYLHF